MLVCIFPALDYYQPFLQKLAFGRQEAVAWTTDLLGTGGAQCSSAQDAWESHLQYRGRAHVEPLFSLISQVHVALW